ncbi:MAG: hypothetical protein U0V75_12770 [Ferruginibacter sp.]
MKKLIVLVMSVAFVSMAVAQVQRNSGKTVKANTASPNTAAVQKESAQNEKMRRKQMMHELKLTRVQKGKLKETHLAAKAKMNEIKNDPALSDADKKAKLKDLRAEQQKNTEALLTDEQKAKLKEMRQKNHPRKKDKAISNQQ